MKKLVGTLTGLFLLVGMAGTPASALPITATGTLTSDHCTDGCGPQTGGFGSIKVVSDELGTGGAVGTLAFTVTLINGNNFVTGGQDVTFGFDLAGNPTINYSVLPTSPDDLTQVWTVVGGNPQSVDTLHADGFGDVEYGVKLEGSGNSPPRPKTLTFSISAVDLNFADLETIMVADIFSSTTRNTGFVDFTGTLTPTPNEENPPGTPIPGAVWLFGGGLGLVAMLSGRRKRKQKCVWETTTNV